MCTSGGGVLRQFAIKARLVSKEDNCTWPVLLKTTALAALLLAILTTALFTSSVCTALSSAHTLASTNIFFLLSSVPVPILLLSVVGSVLSLLCQPIHTALCTRITFVGGFLFLMNWIVFWAPAIVVQGALFKKLLAPYLVPIYELVDSNQRIRDWSARWIYEKPKYADFFATQAFFLVSAGLNLAAVIYWRSTYGELPWWLTITYYWMWIGLGGRGMGAAYSIAHKEGHFNLYRPWIKYTVGNFFENWVGLFYGNVPWNFTTTHISIHHRLDAGRGDTLYNWDIPRSCVPSFMLYLVRGLVHCTGFGGAIQFYQSPRKIDRKRFEKLGLGCILYWVVAPVATAYIFDLSFYFWIMVQPLMCMTFFLSIINHGFHGFIERQNGTGPHVKCVTSTTMVGSYDDYFGEDDHMAHHHHVGVYYKDLPEHQRAQCAEWSKEHASVFQGLDVFTFSVCVLCKAWPVLARRYMDFSGKLTQPQIEKMLDERAQRRDSEYSGVLPAVPWDVKHTGVIDRYEDKGWLSTVYPGFDDWARKWQLFVCWKMDLESLPPPRSLDTLGFEGCAQIVSQMPQD